MTVTVYTRDICPQCDATKRKLNKMGVPYEERELDHPDNASIVAEAMEAGFMAAPIVVVQERGTVIDGVEVQTGSHPRRLWAGYRPDLVSGLITQRKEIA